MEDAPRTRQALLVTIYSPKQARLPIDRCAGSLVHFTLLRQSQKKKKKDANPITLTRLDVPEIKCACLPFSSSFCML